MKLAGADAVRGSQLCKKADRDHFQIEAARHD